MNSPRAKTLNGVPDRHKVFFVCILNFLNIENLSENFILFNDDIFLMNPTTEKDFFEGLLAYINQ